LCLRADLRADMERPRRRRNGKSKPGASHLSTPTRAWERRPEESAEAYAGFLAYRDLGTKRTVRDAAVQIGKSAGLLARWCHRHSWRARAYAWDLEQDREAEAALRQARQRSLERQAQDADRLQRLAMARLGRLVRRDPESGELTLDPEVSIQDAVRIYRLGLEIEQTLPSPPGPDAAEEVDTDELRRMTDEQLRQLVRLARRRAGEPGEEEESEHAATEETSIKRGGTRRGGRACQARR